MERKDFKKLNKNARWCMFLSTLISSLIIGIVITIGYFLLEDKIPSDFVWQIKLVFASILTILALNIIITPIFRFKRYRYYIDSEGVEIEEGMIWRKHVIVPMNRLYQVSISEGPLERFLSLASVNIVTGGGSANLKFLSNEEAHFIADKLKDKINEIALIKEELV